MAFVTFLFLAGLANHQGFAYFMLSVGGTALLLMHQLYVLDVDSPDSCWGTWLNQLAYKCAPSDLWLDNFSSNAFYVGTLVFTGIVIDYARM